MADGSVRNYTIKYKVETDKGSLNKAKSDMKSLESNTKQATSKMKKSFQDFGKAAKEAIKKANVKGAGEKLKKAGDSIGKVGKSLTQKVTAPLMAVGAASMAAFNEVDAGADTIVQKTGASGKALDEMQDSMKNLASEIPTDFETAGSAIGEVNTRFGSTGKELENLSGKFIKFADLNGTDVSTSIDNVSSVLNSFGMDSSKAGGMLDVLNTVGQQTGLSMDQLANDISSNAAQLKDMGFNATQSAQFLGNVEMSGMNTGVAMAAMKKAMKNAADNGMTLDQALGKFSKTMKSNQSDTKKLNAAYDLFGSKGGAAIYNAMKTGKLSLDGFTKDMGKFSGSVNNTFKTTLDPIDQFKMTMNDMKSTGADIGNSIATVVAPQLKKLSGFLKDLSAKWKNLSPGQQNFIVKLAMVAAAVGPVVIGIGKFVTALGQIKKAMAAAKAAFGILKGAGALFAGPLGIVIAVIAAVVIAFTLLYTKCKPFRNFINGLGKTIVKVFKAIPGVIVAVGKKIGSAIKAIARVFKALPGVIVAAGKKVGSGIKAVGGFFKKFGSGVKSSVKYAADSAKANLSAMKAAFKKNGGGIKGVFAAMGAGIVNNAKREFGLMNKITGGKLGQFASLAKSKMKQASQNIKSGLTTGINFIKSLPQKALTWGKDFLDGLIKGIKSKIAAVGKAVKGVGDKIKSFLHFSKPDTGPLADYETWMPDFMQGMARGIQNNKNALISQAKGVAQGLSIMMTANAPTSRTVAGAGTYNRSSVVNQNVTFNSSYTGGTADVQKKISGTTKKSAVDASTYMARAIGYARG